MHMADALLSPAVGGAVWAATAAGIAYSSARVRKETDDCRIPLMGVLGAFLFAAQMINFSIPGTGSSGHLGGGLLQTILLGPHAAFLTIASVLVVQALFFADGGLLALGCNIFNMGFIPAFIVYPFVYRTLIGNHPDRRRMTTAIMISAIVALQLGPLAVVLETVASGISELPFSTFLLLMQPIHLAIGIVEGLVSVAVVSFAYKARPEIIQGAFQARPLVGHPTRSLLLAFLAAAVFMGGILSWFASKDPDGLEWAIRKITGREELKGPGQGLHGILAAVQEKTAFLSDYSFRKKAEPGIAGPKPEGANKQDDGGNSGTGVAGILGSLITLSLAFLVGFILRKKKQQA